MAKGKMPGIKGVGGGTLGTMKHSPKESPESSVSAVGALCRPTRAKLYGYDWEKNRVDNTLNKKRPIRISQAVSILLKTPEPEIIPTCRAFLKKFDYKNDDLKEPISKRLFFVGTDQNESIKPQEMKYAVLMLLGLSKPVAFNILGLHDKNAGQRFALSASFEKEVERVQAERSLYPLEHIEEFPGLQEPLKKLGDALARAQSAVTITNIFGTGKVPAVLSLWQTDNPSALPLDAVLSVLTMSLAGMTDTEIVDEKNRSSSIPVSVDQVKELFIAGDACPFTSAVLRLVEDKRRERQASKAPVTEGKRA